MLNLQEAIERAQLMADESGLLAHQSYDLLVDKLDEVDIYPFTMALVERGIVVKNASVSTKVTSQQIEDKLVKSAQSFSQQSPSGLWLPDSMEEDYPEDGEYESFLEESPFKWPTENAPAEVPVDEPNMEGDAIREALEAAGVRITPEGKVEMYRQNLPGIYKDKLPQGPLPLETAVKYYDQILDMTDAEQQRLNELLDLLTRLSNQTYEIESSLEDLNAYKFSPMSRSKSTQAISQGLENAKALVGQGDWAGAEKALDELRDTLAAYEGERGAAYDQSLSILDALDRLAELKTSDPDAYQQVISGLGAMPMPVAASKYEEDYYDDHGHVEEDFEYDDRDISKLVISEKYLQEIVDEQAETALTDPDGYGPPVSFDEAVSAIQHHWPQANLELVSRGGDFIAEAEVTYVAKRSPATWDDPEETIEDTRTVDLSDDENFAEQIWEVLADAGYSKAGKVARKMAQLTQPDFMIPVDSSNVQEFGYVAEDQTLWVRFLDKGRGSSLYVYMEVEPEIYQQFMAAPSKGKFIWSHMRDRYPYEKVE